MSKVIVHVMPKIRFILIEPNGKIPKINKNWTKEELRIALDEAQVSTPEIEFDFTKNAIQFAQKVCEKNQLFSWTFYLITDSASCRRIENSVFQ